MPPGPAGPSVSTLFPPRRAEVLIVVSALLAALLVHLFGAAAFQAHAGGPAADALPVAAAASGPGEVRAEVGTRPVQLGSPHGDEHRVACAQARAPQLTTAQVAGPALLDGATVLPPQRHGERVYESPCGLGRDVLRELGVQQV